MSGRICEISEKVQKSLITLIRADYTDPKTLSRYYLEEKVQKFLFEYRKVADRGAYSIPAVSTRLRFEL